jgi:hypothetical protein
MTQQSKRVRRRESLRTHFNHRKHLIESLGTPDGLRAFGESVSRLIMTGAIVVLLLSKHPLGESILRFAAALVLIKSVFRFERHGWNQD